MNVECLSDPHSSVILVQRVDHKVCYRVFSHDVTAAILVSQTSPVGVELFSYANAFFCSNKFKYMLATWVKTLYSHYSLMQVLLFQRKMNALSKEMSVPLRCFASIERDLLLVAVILVLRWLVMKRRGLAKVPLLFWVSIIWCLVRSTFLRTPANNPPSPITATMVVKFERTLWERYCSILTAGEQLPKCFMNNYFSPRRVWQARRQLPLWFTMLKTGQWITRLWLLCWLQGDRRRRVEILSRYHCKRLVPSRYLCVFRAERSERRLGIG